ncbi:MAG TPA: TIGR01620 family protein [Devosiaceae bacterium]|jgi:putative membrane protein|nr:TIGR01620 family protein [Devosiaceae bacterium]
MKRPVARPVPPDPVSNSRLRQPRAYAPDVAAGVADSIEPLVENEEAAEVAAPPRFLGRLGKLAWGAGAILVSLALGLAAERLLQELFMAHPWLGWAGALVLAVLLLALAVLGVREVLALRRLRNLDRLRRRAAEILVHDRSEAARGVLGELDAIYAARPDLARARTGLATDVGGLFDGSEIIHAAERRLMAPLDARARTLTAASARRVALVTAVSPRALIDIAFVIFESVRLGGDIARLYGARPGLFGSWRLFGSILAHLAVTGGLVLTDGVMEQLVGQGLATKLSARLGEGVVNGLMTVRVGIAAMRVVRPLPFAAIPQPTVRDFIPDLASVLQKEAPSP